VYLLRYEEFAGLGRVLFGQRLRKTIESEILLQRFRRAIERNRRNR